MKLGVDQMGAVIGLRVKKEMMDDWAERSDPSRHAKWSWRS